MDTVNGYPTHTPERGTRSSHLGGGDQCPSVKRLMKVWKTIRLTLQYSGYNEFTPIWNRVNLLALKRLEDFSNWKQRGVDRLEQLYTAGTMKKFHELRKEFGFLETCQYLQLRHALTVQLEEKPERSSNPLLMTAVNATSLIGINLKIVSKYIFEGIR